MEKDESSPRRYDTATAVGTICLLFLLCAVSGWIYETLFYRIDQGAFIKRGQGFGPWLPIYGVGAVLILLAASRFRDRPLAVFLVSGLTAGVVEFGAGWLLYHMFDGLRLWDYDVEIWNWGNLGGYVCARSVLVFAAGGCAVLYGLVPLLRWLAEKLPKKVFCGIAFTSFGLFALDVAMGYGRFFFGR